MKININIDDVDSSALEYILDLVEQDFIQAGGIDNDMRGSRFFQEVNVLKNRLKQEITIARQHESASEFSTDPETERKVNWVEDWVHTIHK